MNSLVCFFVSLLLSLICCWVRFDFVEGCTVIAVGKSATSEGCTYVAHTDDAGGDSTADIRLVRVPAKTYNSSSSHRRPVYSFKSGYPRIVSRDRGPDYQPVGEQRVTKPLGYIPQVNHTYGYFDNDYGMMNEKQLSIVESTCGSRTVGWPLNLPYGYNMFGIAELTKVALERCETARCAVKLMGGLAVKYGFFSEDSGNPNNPDYDDSAECLAVADKYGEVWIFHVMTGLENRSAIWAAQRVPDNHVTALANSFIIREMNLNDHSNFMASPGVKNIAKKMGWWDASAGPFDFTKAFVELSTIPLIPLYVGRRIWRIFDWFAPSIKLDSTLGYGKERTYPFSVKVDKKVAIESLMALLKDHYEGTIYDMTKGIDAGPFGNPNRFDGNKDKVKGGWERPISSFRSIFSFILESRNDMPDHLGGVVWYGQDKPHGTVYLPFSCAQDDIPKSFVIGKQSQFDPSESSAWRAFNFVNNWAMLRYDIISIDIAQKQHEWQPKAISLVKTVRKSNNKNSSLDEITKVYNNFASAVVKDWWKLGWTLVGRYSDGFIIEGEDQGQLKNPGYPGWWLKQTSFATWPGNTYNPPSPGYSARMSTYSIQQNILEFESVQS